MFVGLEKSSDVPPCFFWRNKNEELLLLFFVSPRSCKNSTSKKNTLKKIWMKPSHYLFWSAMFIVIMVPIPTRSILQLTSFKSMPSSARTPGLFHLILKLVRVIVHRIEKDSNDSAPVTLKSVLSTIQLKKASCNFAVISHFYGRMYKVYQLRKCIQI